MKSPVREILIAFLIGGLVGWFAAARFGQPSWKHRGFDQGRLVQKFSRELKLTPEQTESVRKIFESKRGQFQAVREETKSKFEQMRQETRAEILKVLAPEQVPAYEKMEAAWLEKRQKWSEKRGEWGIKSAEAAESKDFLKQISAYQTKPAKVYRDTADDLEKGGYLQGDWPKLQRVLDTTLKDFSVEDFHRLSLELYSRGYDMESDMIYRTYVEPHKPLSPQQAVEKANAVYDDFEKTQAKTK
jgi:Spy/CpxP family protein refolding chaperone